MNKNKILTYVKTLIPDLNFKKNSVFEIISQLTKHFVFPANLDTNMPPITILSEEEISEAVFSKIALELQYMSMDKFNEKTLIEKILSLEADSDSDSDSDNETEDTTENTYSKTYYYRNIIDRWHKQDIHSFYLTSWLNNSSDLYSCLSSNLINKVYPTLSANNKTLNSLAGSQNKFISDILERNCINFTEKNYIKYKLASSFIEEIFLSHELSGFDLSVFPMQNTGLHLYSQIAKCIYSHIANTCSRFLSNNENREIFKNLINSKNFSEDIFLDAYDKKTITLLYTVWQKLQKSRYKDNIQIYADRFLDGILEFKNISANSQNQINKILIREILVSSASVPTSKEEFVILFLALLEEFDFHDDIFYHSLIPLLLPTLNLSLWGNSIYRIYTSYSNFCSTQWKTEVLALTTVYLPLITLCTIQIILEDGFENYFNENLNFSNSQDQSKYERLHKNHINLLQSQPKISQLQNADFIIVTKLKKIFAERFLNNHDKSNLSRYKFDAKPANTTKQLANIEKDFKKKLKQHGLSIKELKTIKEINHLNSIEKIGLINFARDILISLENNNSNNVLNFKEAVKKLLKLLKAPESCERNSNNKFLSRTNTIHSIWMHNLDRSESIKPNILFKNSSKILLLAMSRITLDNLTSKVTADAKSFHEGCFHDKFRNIINNPSSSLLSSHLTTIGNKLKLAIQSSDYEIEKKLLHECCNHKRELEDILIHIENFAIDATSDFEKSFVENSSINDLDLNLLKKFWGINNEDNIIEILNKYELLMNIGSNRYCTFASILLFGKNTHKVFPSSCITYESHLHVYANGNFSKPQIVAGNIIQTFDKTCEILENTIRSYEQKGFRKKVNIISEYDFMGLGYLLLLALMSRDYQENTLPICISHYSDKIEIKFSGKFMKFRKNKKVYYQPHNPLITKLLSLYYQAKLDIGFVSYYLDSPHEFFDSILHINQENSDSICFTLHRSCLFDEKEWIINQNA